MSGGVRFEASNPSVSRLLESRKQETRYAVYLYISRFCHCHLVTFGLSESVVCVECFSFRPVPTTVQPRHVGCSSILLHGWRGEQHSPVRRRRASTSVAQEFSATAWALGCILISAFLRICLHACECSSTSLYVCIRVFFLKVIRSSTACQRRIMAGRPVDHPRLFA